MSKKKNTKIIDAFNERINSKIKDDFRREVKEDFKVRKRLGIAISNSYERLAQKSYDVKDYEEFMSLKRKADFIKNCDYKSLFVKCPAHKKSHLVYARYCKQRLCPVCNLKRSRKNKESLLRLFDFMVSQQDYKYDRYYHLVLTVPNIKISFDDIDRALAMVDGMYKAFSDMIKEDELFQPYYKKLRDPLCNLRKKKSCNFESCEYMNSDKKCTFDKKVCGNPCFRGTIKVLEFTVKYSHVRRQWEVHPHFHVLLAAQADYHKHKRRFKVLNNRQWGYLWWLYLSRYVDIESYRMQLIDASTKEYTEDEIVKTLKEPLQCKIEMAYDKKVKKEDFMARCEEYVNNNNIDDIDEDIIKITNFSINKSMSIEQQESIKSKLKDIQKALKIMAKDNKEIYKFKTIKEAMAAYEKERFNPQGALAEIGKYTTKDFGAEGIVRLNKDGSVRRKDTDLVVWAIDKLMNGRRLLELTGTFRKAQKYLKINMEDDIDESDEITGGTDDCHWSFEDGKFICLESDAVMSYLVNQFDLKSQRYVESLESSDVDALAEYVIGYYQRQLDKKKVDSNDLILDDDGYNPFDMEMTYDEYLSKKNSDESRQT